VRMPFGKFVGVEVCDLPDNYLEWLLTIELKPYLRDAIEREWGSRSAPQTPPISRENRLTISIKVPLTDVPLVREVLDRGYRAAARLRHPDRGGSDRDMQKLNGLVESLRNQIEALR
jgi:hypothetical protein